MDFEHAVQAWTVGQLRDALAGLPDDLPIIVDVAEEPGDDTVQEQVVIDAGFGHGVDGRGGRSLERSFGAAVSSHREPICNATGNGHWSGTESSRA
jgi:hypothetical protein